jgi:hypothetical protein
VGNAVGSDLEHFFLASYRISTPFGHCSCLIYVVGSWGKNLQRRTLLDNAGEVVLPESLQCGSILLALFLLD